MQLDAQRSARHRAGEDLALGSDVEEPGAERQGDRDARGDERDREDDRVGDLKGRILALGACDAEATAEQALVGVDRVATGDCHHDRANDEREENGREGHGKATGEASGCCRQTRSGTSSHAARPRCLRYAGMSAGGVMEPALIAAWTRSSSVWMSGGS